MTFILRLPAALAELALMLLCFLGAAAAGAALAGYAAPVEQVESVQASAAAAGAASATWLDVGLWAAAGLFFLISAIRLLRRTQGFWTWLLAFACFGGRWAWQQQQTGDLVTAIQGLDINIYRQPQNLLNNLASTESQVALLGIVLVVGLLVFIVDAFDRAHWNRQGA